VSRGSAFAALLLLLLGCSSERDHGADRRGVAKTPPGEPAPGVSSRSDACGYITAAEASRVLGQSSQYRSPEGAPVGEGGHCILVPVSGDAFHGVSVDYQVSRGGSSTKVYDFFAAQKQARPVPGLGDRALWLAAGRTRGNLVVVQDSAVVSIGITDFRVRSDLRSRARAVAERVLERL
jgi:hypothetical protein